jgi:hypothetical protein
VTEFGHPTSAELRTIEQIKMPELMRDNPIFQYFPTDTLDSAMLMWEQEDNWTGLQQVRGIGGDPPKVSKVGFNRFVEIPGYYGEFENIDEIELTERRRMGTFAAAIDVSDLVMKAQDRLLMRRRDRMSSILWTLATTGTFSVSGPAGVILHQGTYDFQDFNATVGWGTVATATPLADFRAVQLLARGASVNFGASAVAYMNRVTANDLLSNVNNGDIYGRRTSGLATVNNLSDTNMILTGEGLPNVLVYDDGYLRESDGAFVPFIPDDKVIVFGQRTNGAPIGRYLYTRNVNNADMSPGPYTAVIDRGADGPGRHVPRSLEVHDGHNGGPVIYFPSAIVVMDVS